MSGSVPDGVAVFAAREFPRLVGALGLYVGDREVAEELAQEALLRACRRWEYVSSLESPGGWVWRVAVNLANSHLRRRRLERRVRDRLRMERLHVPAAELGGVDGERVRGVVAGLPERQRAVLVLRFFLDLSVDETAVRMGTTPDGVRSLTKRAVAQLRELLGPVAGRDDEEVVDVL